VKSNLINDDLIILIIENDKNRNEIDCIIVGNEENVDISPLNKKEELNDLVRMFKIRINWKMIDQQDLLRLLSNIDFYKYDFKKVHQYVSTINVKEVMAEPDRDHYFFSNIDLNISKANDVFRDKGK